MAWCFSRPTDYPGCPGGTTLPLWRGDGPQLLGFLLHPHNSLSHETKTKGKPRHRGPTSSNSGAKLSRGPFLSSVPLLQLKGNGKDRRVRGSFCLYFRWRGVSVSPLTLPPFGHTHVPLSCPSFPSVSPLSSSRLHSGEIWEAWEFHIDTSPIS